MDLTSLAAQFEALRAEEYSRLDDGGHVYLDYTGSGLYAESQLRRHGQFLRERVLGNPHSENPASAAATRLVHEAREGVLDFFGADPARFTVIFTPNASGALKLVGEAFPFREGSRFVLPEDAHNSVNGIRIYAERAGAETVYLPLDGELRLASQDLPPAGDAPSLFAYPAQSNFSGVKHPLSLVRQAREAGYRVLLDAAAYVPTSPLDLDAVDPDFTAVSFYKMFGFPTGVGALIARTEALEVLERPWFAGGTVEFVSVQSRVHRLVTGPEAFEDGTPNFLAVAALREGFDLLRRVGMEQLQVRIGALTSRLLDILNGLRHDNGAPVVEIYGPKDNVDRGGTVSFNVIDPDGRVVPYGGVERAASDVNISLRGGCFCNPGAAEVAFGMPADKALECFRSTPRGSFTLRGFAECLDFQVAVGALRASVGIATNEADLDRLADFLAGYRNCVSPTAERVAG